MSEELKPEELQGQVDQLSEDRTGKLTLLDEQISQELVKANVTEAVIASLRERYMGLKIADINDKETYLIVKEGRKECKSTRVIASKICKKLREDAVAIQKASVAKEKDVTGRIAEIEDALEEQEKWFESEVAKEKEARKRKQEEQLIVRQQTLTNMGALYSEGHFVLGNVAFDFSIVKESDDDIWEETILPEYKKAYEVIQAEYIEQKRKEQNEAYELKRQQEELEQKQKELTQKEADLKAEADRQAAEAKAAREAKEKSRMGQLISLGLKFDFADHFIGYDCFVPILDIMCHDDQKWAKLIEGVTAQVSRKKEEEAEEKRKEQERKELQDDRYAELFPYREHIGEADMNTLYELTAGSYSILLVDSKRLWAAAEEEKANKIAEAAAKKERERIEEEQRQAEVKRKDDLRRDRTRMLVESDLVHHGDYKTLGELSEEAWMKDFNELKANKEEIIRKQEEERKAEELAQASDKEKWAAIISLLSGMKVHDFRSGQYRKKAAILREKLEEIKAL